MALSRLVYVGDGSTTQFAINFPLGYLDRNHITCRVGDEVDGSGNPIYRTLTWVNDSLVQIQGDVPANGVNIVFERTVPNNILWHDYTNGVSIQDEHLDESNKQNIMLVHQVLDGRFTGFTTDIDAGGFKLTNLGDGSDTSDSVTLGQMTSAIAAASGLTGNFPASGVSYDPSTSSLTATNVQDAIDEAVNTAGVRVSPNDTTAGDLEAKLLVGSGLSLSTQNDGSNETRTIDLIMSYIATEVNKVNHPIGKLWISSDPTNPATILGFGTWVQVTDTFIMAAGSTYPAGSVGGSATTTPTANTSALLTYNLRGAGFSGATSSPNSVALNSASSNGLFCISDTNPEITSSTDGSGDPYITSNAGNTAMNNLPPYEAYYVFKRTA